MKKEETTQKKIQFDNCETIANILRIEYQEKHRRRMIRDWKDGLITKKPSKTIQGEAYTIADLLIKHANGIIPAVSLQGLYDEDPTHNDEDMSKTSHLDLAEKQILKENTKYRISEIAENERIREEKEKAISEESKAKPPTEERQ
ncbi:MAG: hypothetical protein [Microvirus sp.]|nr:MAG: hypothetical protein [Microvirus sp.]